VNDDQFIVIRIAKFFKDRVGFHGYLVGWLLVIGDW
jgi:hypothetical protein